MSGRKGRSGPPKNCNATRHPYRTYLKRQVVPKQYHTILRLGEDCERKIRSDLPEMSGKEELLTEGIKILWTCGLLGLAEAKEKGFITTKADGAWDFQDGMKSAGSFIDKAIKGLVALGLERRVKSLPSLSDYLQGKTTHEQKQEEQRHE